MQLSLSMGFTTCMYDKQTISFGEHFQGGPGHTGLADLGRHWVRVQALMQQPNVSILLQSSFDGVLKFKEAADCLFCFLPVNGC